MCAGIDSSMLSGKWDGRVSAWGKLGQLLCGGTGCASVYVCTCMLHQLHTTSYWNSLFRHDFALYAYFN